MKIKILKTNKDGLIRLESSGKVEEIMINEDLLHPNAESISICFRGKNSSGIIDFTPKELEMIAKTVNGRIHLIKGFKKIIADKDEIL